MSIIFQKKFYFLVLLPALLSACDLTPRLSPEEEAHTEEVLTNDLLFYDDQLDLSEHLNPQETPEIETDLSQASFKKNPEKVSVIGRKQNKERRPSQFLYLQEDITQALLEENNFDQQDSE